MTAERIWIMPNYSIPSEVFFRAAEQFPTPFHLYDEKGIEELLAIYEEMVEIMPDASYEDIVLIPQPEY